LIIQFVRRTSGLDIPSEKPDKFTNLEVRRRNVMTVIETSHVLIGVG
jgi:hypothetical protein